MYNKRTAYPAVNDGLQGLDSIKGTSYGLIKYQLREVNEKAKALEIGEGRTEGFDCLLAESCSVEPIKIMRC